MISLCNNSKCKPTNMSFDSNEYNKFAVFPVHIYTPDKIIIGLWLLYDINENEGCIKFLGAIPVLNTGDTVSKERYKLPLNSTVDPLKHLDFPLQITKRICSIYPNQSREIYSCHLAVSKFFCR